MATTTPNFGWPVPTSSDLVKNGATAIEGLGDAIDASLLDLKGGTTGQVLAKASGTDMDFSWTAIDPLVILDAKGDLITATAADTPARLAVGTNGQTLVADSTAATGLKWATPASSSLNSGTTVVATSEATTSTSFTALATAQAVTVTTGTKALVILTTAIDNAASSSSVMGLMTFAISGATTVANSATRTVAIQVPSGFSGSPNPQASGVFYMTGLTAGSNVFTANFRTNASTTFFLNRGITVIDMGS